MKLISKSTFLVKRVFPTIWFGSAAFIALMGFIAERTLPSIKFSAIVFAALIFGYLFFKKSVWDLVDEVYDEGDSLLFRNKNIEERVALKDIMNINYEQISSNQRVSIQVRSSGNLGKILVFNPIGDSSFFSENALIADLIERIDHAKTQNVSQ